MSAVDAGLATVTFGSAVWGSVRFFKTEDSRGRRGRVGISLAGGACMALGIVSLARSSDGSMDTIQGLSRTLFVAALLLFWWTWWVTRRDVMQFAFSGMAPRALQTLGPYRHVRHPYYCSYLLGWIGLLAGAPSGWTLAALALMGGIYHAAARVEENAILSSDLAPSYRAYMARTGRFLPRW